ncbi:MAG: hypothetical protein ACK4RK_05795 [Gemmataceae bacterium]
MHDPASDSLNHLAPPSNPTPREPMAGLIGSANGHYSGPVAVPTGTVQQVLRGVNWRNLVAQRTSSSKPHDLSMRVTPFFRSVNWRNIVRQAADVDTEATVPNPLALENVLADFNWD